MKLVCVLFFRLEIYVTHYRKSVSSSMIERLNDISHLAANSTD
jgi:hypothetical protein